MKAKILLVLSIISLFLLSSITVYTEAQNVQTRVIEGFEKIGTWEVKFSKFRSPKFRKIEPGHTNPEARASVQPDDSQSWIAWFKSTESDFSFLPDGLPPEVRKKEKTILGVRATFEVPGYNWIVIQPKKPLPLYGIVKSLDCWIWGGGYNYDIEFVVKDFKGFYHVLKAGRLNHYGWKNFRVKIPGWIPQKSRWLPKTKPLTFIRFKITANPSAREDNFHAYFDYMKVQTDIYRERFNGDDLVRLNWKKRGVRGSGARGSNEGTGTQGQGNAPQNTPGNQGGQATQPPAGQ